MFLSQSTAVAPFAVHSFPDSGHTCVSCPHPVPLCPRNNLLPKNDCPNMVSSSNAETGETASSMSTLSTALPAQIWITSAVSLPPNARGPAAHSALPPRIQHNHKFPVSLLLQPPLPLPAKSEIDTSVSIQRDTRNAIWYVITYEICSLLTPFVRSCGTTRPKDSSERPFRPFPSGTGIASPHDHTRRVWVSTSN